MASIVDYTKFGLKVGAACAVAAIPVAGVAGAVSVVAGGTFIGFIYGAATDIGVGKKDVKVLAKIVAEATAAATEAASKAAGEWNAFAKCAAVAIPCGGLCALAGWRATNLRCELPSPPTVCSFLQPFATVASLASVGLVLLGSAKLYGYGNSSNEAASREYERQRAVAEYNAAISQ